MSTGSTIVEFRTAMITNLAARGGVDTSTVTVQYSTPLTDQHRYGIWWATEEPAFTDNEYPVMKSGTKRVRETWTSTLVIQTVIHGRTTTEESDTDAVALLAELQQEIAEDPTIQLSSISWCQLDSWSMVSQVINKAAVTRIECQIQAFAELAP